MHFCLTIFVYNFLVTTCSGGRFFLNDVGNYSPYDNVDENTIEIGNHTAPELESYPLSDYAYYDAFEEVNHANRKHPSPFSIFLKHMLLGFKQLIKS